VACKGQGAPLQAPWLPERGSWLRGGLRILEALLFRFHNVETGLCCPSYSALQDEIGCCRQTVSAALKRLKAAEIIVVTRRLVRKVVDGVRAARQASNLYAFCMPATEEHKAFAAPHNTMGAGQTEAGASRKAFPLGLTPIERLLRNLAASLPDRLEPIQGKKRGCQGAFHG
jgi:DNA-binding transcriptional regulator YhcF (GntR family)